MVRQELERVRPRMVPLRWKHERMLQILSISHRALTDEERGVCIASVMLIIEQITDLRRTIRQCNRSIDNLQRQCRSTVYSQEEYTC